MLIAHQRIYLLVFPEGPKCVLLSRAAIVNQQAHPSLLHNPFCTLYLLLKHPEIQRKAEKSPRRFSRKPYGFFMIIIIVEDFLGTHQEPAHTVESRIDRLSSGSYLKFAW